MESRKNAFLFSSLKYDL